MKRRKIGTKEEHISYLKENEKMDRSILAFNLQAIYGLKKKEAAATIREWFIAEEKKEKEENEEEENEEDGETKTESTIKEGLGFEAQLRDDVPPAKLLEVLVGKIQGGEMRDMNDLMSYINYNIFKQNKQF